MTIKRNGDRVVLKDGKVSCSCCDTGCCMYPAQALADGDYTENDLPDAVILNYDLVEDFELTRSGSEFIGGIYKIALGTLPNSPETQWLLYVNNERDNNNPCLITGDGGLTPGDDIVEDQFADTYTASGVPDVSGLSTITLTRTSLCIWEGVNSCGDSVILGYNQAGDTILDTYHWYIIFPTYLLNNCDFTEAQGDAEKTDPQSSPAGSYINVNVNITVS